jgi:hypothetical protein
MKPMTGMAVAFDTLAYAKRLRNAGCSEQLAEVQAEALAAIVTDHIATKQDIRDLEHRLEVLEHRLTLRLGAMLTVAVGTMAALAKLL